MKTGQVVKLLLSPDLQQSMDKEFSGQGVIFLCLTTVNNTRIRISCSQVLFRLAFNQLFEIFIAQDMFSASSHESLILLFWTLHIRTRTTRPRELEEEVANIQIEIWGVL